MELTKEDKQNIISGLIHKRWENDLIIEEQEKLIRINHHCRFDETEDENYEKVEKLIKDDYIIKFYKKENKRIFKVMEYFGFKFEETDDDLDDNSWEEEQEFNKDSDISTYSEIGD